MGKNPNYQFREEYELNGSYGDYNHIMCYHPSDDCRARNERGECICLHDTMFVYSDGVTYDCPFYKTEQQFMREVLEGRKRRQMNE